MEVFDFMPYTYYTRMTVGGGKEPAHKRAFLLIGRPTILRFVETLQRVSKSAEVGPRRTMVSFIGMLTLVHPFATTWHFPSRGNEKIGGTGYCVTYDTDSQSRNAPCVPFRGRGPRSGEGMYEGKNDYDTRCGRDRRKAAL